ncbi:MAG: hypothetical protein LBL07_07910 [Tannerella sp.]|nr:hypothetical protein [Tannerella sp.]
MDSTNSVIENNLLIDFIVNPGTRIYRHLLLLLFFGLLLLSNIPFPHDTETVEVVFTSGMSCFVQGSFILTCTYWCLGCFSKTGTGNI